MIRLLESLLVGHAKALGKVAKVLSVLLEVCCDFILLKTNEVILQWREVGLTVKLGR